MHCASTVGVGRTPVLLHRVRGGYLDMACPCNITLSCSVLLALPSCWPWVRWRMSQCYNVKMLQCYNLTLLQCSMHLIHLHLLHNVQCTSILKNAMKHTLQDIARATKGIKPDSKAWMTPWGSGGPPKLLVPYISLPELCSMWYILWECGFVACAMCWL